MGVTRVMLSTVSAANVVFVLFNMDRGAPLQSNRCSYIE